MVNNNQLKNINIINTNELVDKLGSSNLQLIDIRPIEAYNGWRLNNENRGGHIRGSRSLPFSWLSYIDWIEIVRSKGILTDNELIIYGYNDSESEKVANQFLKAGYGNVSVYHSFNKWVDDSSLTMDKLTRYQYLVSANWVNDLINKGSADEYDNKKYVICHAHYQNREAYEKGHIPEAIDLDTNLLESSDTWNRRSPKELENTFKKLGITTDTTVILYGRFSFPNNNDLFPGSSAGHLGAFRCALIMMYAGIKDVRILNGGLQSWIDAGFETTKQEYQKQPIDDFGGIIPANPEIIIDISEAKEFLKNPNKNLVSVRSWKEFIGEVSGYNYIEKKGRIPGAVFGNCGSDAYHMENYRNLDHTCREYHEIERIWSEVGITSDKYNSFYCGTGWRGSEAFFNAWLMGWNNISVFDGGWFEWSNQENIYETGCTNNLKEQEIVGGNY